MRFAGIKDQIKPVRFSAFEQVKEAHLMTDESRRYFIQFAYIITLVFRLFVALIIATVAYYTVKQLTGVTDEHVEIACIENGGRWDALPGADDQFACNTD